MVPARALILAASMLLAACSQDAPRPREPSTAQRAARAAFEQGEAVWRAQRREELLAPDGWTSLVGLHWITPGAHYVGAARDNGIRLSVGPQQLGVIDLQPERIRFVAHRGVQLHLDGKPLRGATTLRADDHADGASRITFDDGKGIATVIRRGDRHALRVKHADAPSRTAFAGLTYWPGGPAWALDGEFIPHPPGRTLDIASITGGVEPVPNPGVVRFKRGGRTWTLEALEGGDGGLFLIFADRTSGHGSYGAGRYLDTAPPDAQGRVRVDFNRAYNPPCAFTPYATCPLPPPENRLDLAIAAGEKTYAGQH